MISLCVIRCIAVLEGSWVSNWESPWNTFEHHATMLPKGSRDNDQWIIQQCGRYLPHIQTQLQDGSRLILSWPFSYISFSSLIFPCEPYRIFLPYLLRLPCHFYLLFEQHFYILSWNIEAISSGRQLKEKYILCEVN